MIAAEFGPWRVNLGWLRVLGKYSDVLLSSFPGDWRISTTDRVVGYIFLMRTCDLDRGAQIDEMLTVDLEMKTKQKKVKGGKKKKR